MPQELRDKVAVVTGAANGIGRALALRLGAEGCVVALADIDGAAVEAAAALVRERGGRASAHTVDVANSAAMRGFAAAVLRQHGQVDILVNNAGVALGGRVEEQSVEEFDWLIGINLRGVFNGVACFLPQLKQRERAWIVNMSSVFGLFGPPGHAIYAASKFAVRGFSESLRHELADSGITVCCVHPAGVKTAIAQHARMPSGWKDATRRLAAIEAFHRVARLTPEQAADRIVVGMKRGRVRIRVGGHAIFIDLLQRLLPVAGGRLLLTAFSKAAGFFFARRA